MRIRSATVADAPRLIELWTAAGLKFRSEDVPEELAVVLAKDPHLVLVAEDAAGLTAAVFGTFDGRRGWVNRLATRADLRGQGHASTVLADDPQLREVTYAYIDASRGVAEQVLRLYGKVPSCPGSRWTGPAGLGTIPLLARIPRHYASSTSPPAIDGCTDHLRRRRLTPLP